MSPLTSFMDWFQLTDVSASGMWIPVGEKWIYYTPKDTSKANAFESDVNRVLSGGRIFADLCLDSRKVQKGDVYVALKGSYVDGHQFIGDALNQGASLVLCESDKMPEQAYAAHGVSILVIPDLRFELGRIAQMYYGNPANKLSIIGVTGTNGKTTISTLIWQALTELGVKAGLLGTVGGFIGKQAIELPKGNVQMTTSDAIQLAIWMKEMVDQGASHVVLEASSHALDQGRLAHLPFTVTVYSNLSHEHLDYHGSLKAYVTAKKRLFDGLSGNSTAIVNVSDAWGEFMVQDSAAHVWSVAYNGENGESVKARDFDDTQDFRELSESLVPGVDDKECYAVRFTNENPAEGGGLLIELSHGNSGTPQQITSPLQGKFNAMNVSQAYLALQALGWEPELAAEALSKSKGAPGRMQKVQSGLGAEPLVLVDYAHTPDALDKVASATSELLHSTGSDGKLWILFGCGGERDRLKRPEMAKIAQSFADHVVVTSDNPRNEDPEAILDEVCAGFNVDGAPFERITDRKTAIQETILKADTRDIVLLAGKGHETGQVIAGETLSLDDREEALKALRLRAQKMEEV